MHLIPPTHTGRSGQVLESAACVDLEDDVAFLEAHQAAHRELARRALLALLVVLHLPPRLEHHHAPILAQDGAGDAALPELEGGPLQEVGQRLDGLVPALRPLVLAGRGFSAGDLLLLLLLLLVALLRLHVACAATAVVVWVEVVGVFAFWWEGRVGQEN